MTAAERVLKAVTPDVRVIAIDGRSASGKTTISVVLAEMVGGEVVHMDDFFLPPSLRTQERLSEAGGNVHRERFIEEVLSSLLRRAPFRYRLFDCSVMDYSGWREVRSYPVIVEGAYSMHPAFGKYYDLSVFMDISPEEQIWRITMRNGEEKAEAFRTRWIPLEEAYIKAFHPEKNAEIIIDAVEYDRQ